MNTVVRRCVIAACTLAAVGCGNTSSGSGTPQAQTSTGGVGAPAAGAAVVNQTGGTPAVTAQAGNTSTASGTSGVPGGTAGAHASAGANAAVGGAGAGAAGASGSAAAAGAAGAAGSALADGGTPSAGCDRACLLAVMQGYLDALVAKDPTKIKTSASLKYTENGMVIKLGDGLWKTASKIVPDERLDFADPTLMNVTSQVVVDENGTTPVLYQARLKVVDGEITEIESMAVRQAGAANGFFTPANMKPEPAFLAMIDPAKRMTRDAMNTLMQDYLDYLEGKKKGNEVPFDTNCKRYENGVATASGLASFQAQSWNFMVTRRILIIDEEAGIVWGMFPFTQAPSTLVVGEAFKMVDGKIMMIQAVMADMPANAWN